MRGRRKIASEKMNNDSCQVVVRMRLTSQLIERNTTNSNALQGLVHKHKQAPQVTNSPSLNARIAFHQNMKISIIATFFVHLKVCGKSFG